MAVLIHTTHQDAPRSPAHNKDVIGCQEKGKTANRVCCGLCMFLLRCTACYLRFGGWHWLSKGNVAGSTAQGLTGVFDMCALEESPSVINSNNSIVKD